MASFRFIGVLIAGIYKYFQVLKSFRRIERHLSNSKLTTDNTSDKC